MRTTTEQACKKEAIYFCQGHGTTIGKPECVYAVRIGWVCGVTNGQENIQRPHIQEE